MSTLEELTAERQRLSTRIDELLAYDRHTCTGEECFNRVCDAFVARDALDLVEEEYKRLTTCTLF